jgi:aspartate/methionine/tyrosine aminotransferase
MSRLELENTKFSGIGEMFNLANKLGGDLVRFETGDVDLPTPTHIVERAYKEMKAGQTQLRSIQGI